MTFTPGQVLTAAQLNALDITSLTVDTDTLVVDATNDRVGINQASPSVALDVGGSVVIDDDLTVDTSTLKVDSTNNRVGIGTTSPSSKLHIDHSGEALRMERSGYDTYGFQQSAGTGIEFRNFTDARTEMYFNGAGNVGIGTTSPAHPLHVTGSDNRPIRAESSVSGSYIDIQDSATTGEGYVGIGAVGNDARFIAGGSTRMAINSSGNVGIGTTSPDTKLEVETATGTNPSTPTEIRISTSTNGGSWSTTNPWGRLSFWSADTSNGGSKIHAAIATTAIESFGGLSALQFFVHDGSSLRRNMTIPNAGDLRLQREGVVLEASSKSYWSKSPPTGTGNDAEWTAAFGYYYLRRNSSVAADKVNIQTDLGTHLTADMIDSVVPKMWARTETPDYPEIGPIADDMDLISPFLVTRGTDANGDVFMNGIDRNAYLSLLVLAVKDLRARVATLEAA